MNLNLNQNFQQNIPNTAQNIPLNSQNISQSSFQAFNQIDRSINNLQSSQMTTSSQEIQSQINASQGLSSNDSRVQNATIGVFVGVALIIYLIFELYIYDQFDL